MESAEDLHANVASAPVFVDDTGRRRVLTRRAGRILVIGFTGYIGLMVIGFARDPRVGPIHLPTFGPPTLGLMTPPAPSVLGEQTGRTGSDADVEVATSGARTDPTGAGYRPGRPESSPGGPEMVAGGTKAGAPLTSASGTPQPGLRLTPVGSPAGSATTTKTTTRPSGAGSEPPATTTSSTTTATTGTSKTSTTASSERGQGSEQGTGAVSAKGPDGSGAPGQQRRTTTTTAG